MQGLSFDFIQIVDMRVIKMRYLGLQEVGLWVDFKTFLELYVFLTQIREIVMNQRFGVMVLGI